MLAEGIFFVFLQSENGPSGHSERSVRQLFLTKNMTMIVPKALKTGDLVALVATARKVSPEEMVPAVATLQRWGLRVRVPEDLYETENQLAGSDEHRARMLQELLDDAEVKAIFCCRGGYGTVRIIDKIDFQRFKEEPKWIVGYSDVTVLHSHLQATLGVATLHATMPINFPAEGENTDTESLRRALMGEPMEPLTCQPHRLNRAGEAEGVLVGGNLSILYSLCGSRSQVDTRGKILIIEDLDEYLYHIDRMMQGLKRSSMLEGLAGLAVGHLSDMHDNAVPFGKTAEEIVAEAVAEYGYPVVFGVNVGHCVGANYAVKLGSKYRLEAHNSKNSRIFAP